MRRGGPHGARQDGAVAVEFAIILPILLMILFGVLEFGRVFSQYQMFQSAAREGARCAAVRGASLAAGLPACDIQGTITAAASPYTPQNPASVTVGGGAASGGCTDLTRGQDVRVSWSQDFQIDIPFWKDVTMTRTIAGVFRCE